ncbi:MAB_1171c family putative transporter [Nocardia lijiangensis]|uniref:MAB_1171c family putative transporter n=1 Tax=Nocardia lijiangensis TaxID=299618 RepID=UPI003D703C28
MTSPIPEYLTVPMIVGIVLTLIGRWLLLRDTIVDRLINRAIAASLVGMLLRESWFEQALTSALPGDDDTVVNLARQLSFGAILLIVSNIYGIAKLWDGADPDRAWQRQRVYDLIVATVTVVILVAGTPARRANLLVDQLLGWPTVVLWVSFCLPVGITAVLVGRICVREMLTGDITRQERVVFVVILCTAVALGLDASTIVIETIGCVLTDQPVLDPEMNRKALSFATSTFFAVSVSAIPLISTLATHLGCDRTGRYLRRLQPLWTDLTAAVPEVVLATTADRRQPDPAIRLHRMTMEIRDSLLHLRRYVSLDDADYQDSQVYTRRIAEAIAAKTAGRPPVDSTAKPKNRAQPGVRDLNAELHELLALAHAWPQVRGLITTHGQRRDTSQAR